MGNRGAAKPAPPALDVPHAATREEIVSGTSMPQPVNGENLGDPQGLTRSLPNAPELRVGEREHGLPSVLTRDAVTEDAVGRPVEPAQAERQAGGAHGQHGGSAPPRFAGNGGTR
eukprot:6452827-Prorocentrum_lima.AAC.1